VAMGRPGMYGLALGGPEGVKSVYDKLKQELTATMQAAGCGKIADIGRSFVARAPGAEA
jgi:L-lactate oxidase